jgi:hypothetical protein
VRHLAARTLIALAGSVLVFFGAAVSRLQGTPSGAEVLRHTGEHRVTAERTVFLVGKLSEQQTLELTTALAASGHPGAVLFDTPATVKYARDFLQRFGATQLVAVGDKDDLENKYHVQVAATFGGAAALQEALFSQARRVVVAPTEDRRLTLRAACLAGVLQAPLLLTDGSPNDTGGLKQKLAAWQTEEIYAVGTTAQHLGKLAGPKVIRLADEDAVAASYLQHQLKNGPIATLVVANPEDLQAGLGRMSTLVPWLTLQKRAALVLTNDAGTNAEEAIAEALKCDGLARADTLLLAGNLKAIAMKKRPNPLAGGRDQEIEMEPMTPDSDKPCSFATGRLFHDDRGIIGLMLARQRLLAREKAPKALIVSNPGGGLPLLETFSRNTANEFKNAGYETMAYFGNEANKTETRRHLPDADIFLWEGHHSTLVGTYGVHQWPEPLKPSLVFLQSCLALTEPKAHPFLQRGAVAVVGSSTRTYSGSGGAFSLAFFDTLLYEEQTLGASLRQAKNFMLAFAALKKRRFGEDSKLGGANIRSAWAFTLWGDPTIKMPRAAADALAVPPVKHVIKGNTIVVTLPDEAHDKIDTPRYQAVVPANARLAGLVRKQDMVDQHKLVPFVFAEVQLPKAIPGKTPQIRTRLPDTHWVFCYDDRCRRGYLLLTPRASDHGDLRFQVTWE